MDFISFDFETTGGKSQKPCSIGITVVEDNQIIDNYYSLINPEERINPYATKIHGITDNDVSNAPIFPDVWKEISKYFKKDCAAIAHNVAFDKSVLLNSLSQYNLDIPKCSFVCSMKYCQEIYPHLGCYNLEYLSKAFELETMCTHNSLDDSKAVAELILKIIDNEIPREVLTDYKPPKSNKNKKTEKSQCELPILDYCEPDCVEFENNRFVITGDLIKYTREEIENFVISKGGQITGSVSSKTNFVIVGFEDISSVSDKEHFKSKKIIETEEYIKKGKNIKFVKGNDFVNIMLNSKTECNVNGLIEPKKEYHIFLNEQEKLGFLKKIKLMSPKSEECKQFFYNGLYSDGICKCDIVGYIDTGTLVIELDKHLHCINTDCLSEMQPLVKEIEKYSNNIPVYVGKAEVSV